MTGTVAVHEMMTSLEEEVAHEVVDGIGVLIGIETIVAVVRDVKEILGENEVEVVIRIRKRIDDDIGAEVEMIEIGRGVEVVEAERILDENNYLDLEIAILLFTRALGDIGLYL